MRRTNGANGVAAAALLAALTAGDAAAQGWPLHYPEPAAGAVRVTRDVPFATSDTTRLLMDVYRPAGDAGPAPALLFYSALYWPGERRTRARESNEHVRSWARIAAANGIVAVVPDLRGEPGTGNATTPARARDEDFARLLAHLREHADRYGIDRERLAVFGASGSVAAALPAVQDPRRDEIRAAVMYYGSADVAAFRVDLPVLYVRAGLDAPELNARIVRLAALAAAQNAPVTLLNHPTGHHAFEGVDDDATTRHVIDETIGFVKRATAPAYQAALRERRLHATAAGHMSTGNYREAARAYADVVRQRPADARLRFEFAHALLRDEQFGAACAEFRRDTPPSFMAIVPGTRACVRAGAVDTAVAWLRTVRRDWMQSEYLRALRTDSTFAPLWGRADFEALFRP